MITSPGYWRPLNALCGLIGMDFYLIRMSAPKFATEPLPAIKTMTDLGVASERVIRGVTGGQLTTSEGQAFMGMLDDKRRMIESVQLDLRGRALEASSKEGHNKDHDSHEPRS